MNNSWHGRRIGQADAERAAARQGEVQVLLVQRDPEARLEVPVHHALAMDLEDAGGREAAHQRLTHARRVGSGLGGEEQRLADRLDGQGYDDLVRDLGGLPVAVAADERDGLAHPFEQRLRGLEGAFRATHHDREGRGLGPHLSARHGGVEVVAAVRRLTRPRKSLVAIGEIELMSTTILPGTRLWATPPAPKRTVSTSPVSGSMVMTMSALPATSPALPQGRAPSRTRMSGTAERVWTNRV